MARPENTFAADVERWALETNARLNAVFRESVQRVDAEMLRPVGAGGNLPVDTGFLRASRVASTAGPAPMRESAVPVKGKTYAPNDDDFVLILTSLEAGQTIWLCFTAAYARRHEYGFSGKDALGRTYKQAGRGFVRKAAQRWQTIVNEAVADLQSQKGDDNG